MTRALTTTKGHEAMSLRLTRRLVPITQLRRNVTVSDILRMWSDSSGSVEPHAGGVL